MYLKSNPKSVVLKTDWIIIKMNSADFPSFRCSYSNRSHYDMNTLASLAGLSRPCLETVTETSVIFHRCLYLK